MPQWHLTHGESYLVTGEPAIVADLTHSITSSIELLLIAVVLVMAATLGLVLRGPPRLLPLAVALLATALTFAGFSLAGGSLAMAQVAVLPVLIGLAVDYAIQFQARAREAERETGATGPSVAPSPQSIRRAAILGGPTIATAAAASAAALLVLLLSPVPMVRGFSVLLAVGVAVALACAFTAGAAGLALAGSRRPPRIRAGRPGAGRRLGAPLGGLAALRSQRLAPAVRGARELLVDNALVRLLTRTALVGAVRHPGRVLGVGLALAALGWGLDTQTRVETDITKLVPQNLGSL